MNATGVAVFTNHQQYGGLSKIAPCDDKSNTVHRTAISSNSWSSYHSVSRLDIHPYLLIVEFLKHLESRIKFELSQKSKLPNCALYDYDDP